MAVVAIHYAVFLVLLSKVPFQRICISMYMQHYFQTTSSGVIAPYALQTSHRSDNTTFGYRHSTAFRWIPCSRQSQTSSFHWGNCTFQSTSRSTSLNCVLHFPCLSAPFISYNHNIAVYISKERAAFSSFSIIFCPSCLYLSSTGNLIDPKHRLLNNGN